MESSNEYHRQHLIDEDQYKQWQNHLQAKSQWHHLDRIFGSSRWGEIKDLFYRRLRERGNKDNWLMNWLILSVK